MLSSEFGVSCFSWNHDFGDPRESSTRDTAPESKFFPPSFVPCSPCPHPLLWWRTVGEDTQAQAGLHSSDVSCIMGKVSILQKGLRTQCKAEHPQTRCLNTAEICPLHFCLWSPPIRQCSFLGSTCLLRQLLLSDLSPQGVRVEVRS